MEISCKDRETLEPLDQELLLEEQGVTLPMN